MSIVAMPQEGSAGAEPGGPQFQRRLGLFDATMLVAGSMIGSGIFIVSADIARDVGSSGWLLFCWALTGLMTIIAALSFAELAAMMPATGGQYVYLREAYGPLWAFLFGWTNFLIIQTGYIAAVGVAFAKFLGVLVPSLGTDQAGYLFEVTDLNLQIAVPLPWMDEPLVFFQRDSFAISRGQLVAVGIAVFLTYLNCLGVREGKWVQNVFTVAKTVGLIALIMVGLTLAANAEVVEQNLADPWGGITETPRYAEVSKIAPWPVLAITLVLCGAIIGPLFSSDAWANVTFAAAEVHEPRRNLPRCLLLGVALVITLYLLANTAYMTALPVRGQKDEILVRDLKVKKLEADAADAQATVKRYDFEIANLQLAIERGEKRLAWLERIGDPARIQGVKDELRINENTLALITFNRPRIAIDADLIQEGLENARAAMVFARGMDHAQDDRVATAVLERVSPGLGVTLMALAIMVSTFGCVNGIVLAGARLNYALARDGLFFQAVGRLNRRGVPMAGLIYQMIWSIVLIFSGSYNDLIAFTIFAALLFYILTIGAVYVLRRTRPDLPRPYRAFGYPVVPAIYIVLCAVIMLALLVVKPVYSWPSFIIILSGIPIYWLWRSRGVAKT